MNLRDESVNFTDKSVKFTINFTVKSVNFLKLNLLNLENKV